MTNQQKLIVSEFDRSESFDRIWLGPPELKPAVYRTQSEKDTWYAVAVENEYHAPAFQADDVVIDIGAHIGSFAYLAYKLGSRSIYGFEIDPWHYEAAVANVRGLDDGLIIYHAAVVRGDGHRASQYYYNGAWNAFGIVGKPVESVSLDQILEPHEKVRFIKTDSEGAEYPVLYTCTQLHKVQEIAGEWHHIKDDLPELQHLPYPVSPQGLAQFLYDQGFSVRWTTHGSTGNFYATRRESEHPIISINGKSVQLMTESIGNKLRVVSIRLREIADDLDRLESAH